MDKQEWRRIVAKLGASFPGQELRPETAVEWYEELADRRADLIWAAVRRLRRDQPFRPSLAELLSAYHAEVRAERARIPALPANDADGVPPPADFQAARERLLAGTKLDGKPPPPAKPAPTAPAPYGQWGQDRLDALKKPETAG